LIAWTRNSQASNGAQKEKTQQNRGYDGSKQANDYPRKPGDHEYSNQQNEHRGGLMRIQLEAGASNRTDCKEGCCEFQHRKLLHPHRKWFRSRGSQKENAVRAANSYETTEGHSRDETSHDSLPPIKIRMNSSE
jgi:hypothetical protein